MTVLRWPARTLIPGALARADDANRTELIALLLPLVTWLASASLAASLVDPIEAAESRFLALITGGVVAAITVLMGRRQAWTAATGTAVLMVLWLVHQDAHRGALVIGLLLAGLTVAGLRSWQRIGHRLEWWLAMSLGLQLIARCDLLLPPLLDARTLISLLVLPVIGATALYLISHRLSPLAALGAGAGLLALAPGWNVTTTASVVALVACDLMLAAQLGRAARAVAAISAIAAVGAAGPAAGLAAAAGGGLAWRRPRQSEGGVGDWTVELVVATLISAWAWFGSGASTDSAFNDMGAIGHRLLIVALLLPAAWWPPKGRSLGRRLAALVGLIVTLAGLLTGIGSTVDIELAGAGILILAMASAGAGRLLRLGRRWLIAVAIVAIAIGSYPWLRQEPLVSMTTPTASVLSIGQRLTPAPFILSAASPSWITPFDYGTELVLDTSLVHGVALPSSQPVVAIRLARAGEQQEVAVLRTADDTADWAAARADVKALRSFRAPAAWSYRLAADGTFFSSRFRSRVTLPPVVARLAADGLANRNEPGQLIIELVPELPNDTQLVVHHVELRR